MHHVVKLMKTCFSFVYFCKLYLAMTHLFTVVTQFYVVHHRNVVVKLNGEN